MKVCIKELCRRYFQVFTDIKEVLHGRQGASGGNGLDITFILAEIQAHLIFRDILFDPQFGYPVTDEFLSIPITSLHTFSYDCKLFIYSKLRIKKIYYSVNRLYYGI